MSKKKKIEVGEMDIENIEELNDGEIDISSKIKVKDKLNNKNFLIKYVMTLNSRIGSLSRELNEHKNEPYATIKIKERDGTYGDWTGIFKVTNDEKEDLLKVKVEGHFDRYFRKSNLGKEFIIVISNKDEDYIYKTINT